MYANKEIAFTLVFDNQLPKMVQAMRVRVTCIFLINLSTQ